MISTLDGGAIQVAMKQRKIELWNFPARFASFARRKFAAATNFQLLFEFICGGGYSLAGGTIPPDRG
jgi:hypothetical protein